MSPIPILNGGLNFTVPTMPLDAGSVPASTSSTLSNQIVNIAIPSLFMALCAWLGRNILKHLGSMLYDRCKKWWAAHGPLTETAVSGNQSYAMAAVISPATNNMPVIAAPASTHIANAPSQLDNQPRVQLHQSGEVHHQHRRHGDIHHAEREHHNKMRDEEGVRKTLNNVGHMEEDVGDAEDTEEQDTQGNKTENDSEGDPSEDSAD